MFIYGSILVECFNIDGKWERSNECMLLAYVHAKLEARITLRYVQCESHIYIYIYIDIYIYTNI